MDAETIPPPEKKPKIDGELSDELCDEEPEVVRSVTVTTDQEFSEDEFVVSPRALKDKYSDDELDKSQGHNIQTYDDDDEDDFDDDFDNPSGEKFEKYCKELAETQGYDVETRVKVRGVILRINPLPPYMVLLTNQYSKDAITLYNTHNDTKFQFLEVDKVNVTMDCTACSYITFRANDGAEIKTFQTKVYPMPGGAHIDEVRLKQ